MIRPTDQLVIVVWSVNHEVRNRWMVTCLLHEDLCSILSIGLVCFTKDWIERLLKDLFLDKEGQVVDYEELHSLNWIAYGGRLIQID